MKKIITTLGTLLVLASCADKKAFEITLTVPEDFKDQTVMAIDAITGDTLALATATDTIVQLKGSVEKPVYGFIICNNMHLTPLVIEPGKILVDDNGVTGTPNNDQFAELIAQSTGSESDNDLVRDFMRNHASNPHSLALFEQFVYLVDMDIVDSITAHNPSLFDNPNFQHIRASIETRESTSAGGKMVDFTLVDGAGKQTSLSSIVENAPLTIVDFWASWCGPCRAEIPNLIDIYDKYKAQGLQVVGVDVWERNDADGSEAAKEMKIPYTVLYGGTQETTDLYGILGIPTILLIDRDGKIIARDIRGEELGEEVAAYFNK